MNETLRIDRHRWNEMRQLILRIPSDMGWDSELRASIQATIFYRMYGLMEDHFRARQSSWKPNEQKYRAYKKWPKNRRKGKGWMPENRPGGPVATGQLGRPPQGTGELSQPELEKWWYVYHQNFARFRMQNMSKFTSKRYAARIAWKVLLESGAKTKFQTIGRRNTQVGVQTGKLKKSLSQGVLTGPPGQREYVPKSKWQSVKIDGSAQIIGTELPYAQFFNKKRRLFPSPVPPDWMQEATDGATQAIVEAILGMGT